MVSSQKTEFIFCVARRFGGNEKEEMLVFEKSKKLRCFNNSDLLIPTNLIKERG